jgi:hypothetical protein
VNTKIHSTVRNVFLNSIFSFSDSFFNSTKYTARFPGVCKPEAKWMFGHLDNTNDGHLSLQELYDLEHDQVKLETFLIFVGFFFQFLTNFLTFQLKLGNFKFGIEREVHKTIHRQM